MLRIYRLQSVLSNLSVPGTISIYHGTRMSLGGSLISQKEFTVLWGAAEGR